MDSWIGGVPLPSIDSIAIFAIDAVVPVLEISPYTALRGKGPTEGDD